MKRFDRRRLFTRFLLAWHEEQGAEPVRPTVPPPPEREVPDFDLPDAGGYFTLTPIDPARLLPPEPGQPG